MMSDILIVADPNNVDHNKLEQIADAVRHCGGNIESVDAEHCVIEALIDSREIPVVERMEGVSYVRSIFTYHPGSVTEAEAQ
jgi:hypothetical protein